MTNKTVKIPLRKSEIETLIIALGLLQDQEKFLIDRSILYNKLRLGLN